MAWARPDIWEALALSLQVAAVSTALALVLGTLAAAAVWRSRFFGREAVSLLLVLPIALPGIITGISLRSAFSLGGDPLQLLDHRARARDLLHRRGLQQRHWRASAAPRAP